MSGKTNIKRVLISGGGTGGHIFPAIAIADEIKLRNPHVEIHFVGALGKMEMEKVPQAGYSIDGLQIAGFQRRLTFSNLLLPFKIIKSLLRARNILKKFEPQVVVGVGGYASGPTLQAATQLGIPTLIQEQNSFPGKTNKILARKVNTICVAYEGLERFFPKEKLVLTGNPTRRTVVDITDKREEGIRFFGLDPDKKTILIIGGSLGARTLNQSMEQNLNAIPGDIQVIWQCGKLYYTGMSEVQKQNMPASVKLHEFISRMDLAYAVADVVISRAGAISVSELCLVKKPCLFVPSPNVAEDHQTKNAMALVNANAAVLIKDSEAKQRLIPTAINLLEDEAKMRSLSEHIASLGIPDATERIVDQIELLVK